VNLTASLLGFSAVKSLSLVAEGPGEVISRPEVAQSLRDLGKALATGERVGKPDPGRACPVCRSDFFSLEPPLIVCPVCGLEGDLETYTREGRFEATAAPARWGQDWLSGHIDSWIRPSLERYAGARRDVLKNLKVLKQKYDTGKERGNRDVQ
jgi:hypothetical protein